MRGFVYRFEVALDRARDDETRAKRALGLALALEREREARLSALREEIRQRIATSRPQTGSTARQFAEGDRLVERAEALAAEALHALADARGAADSARTAAEVARRRRESFERHRARALERRALELEIQASTELDETNRGCGREAASEMPRMDR